MLDVQVDGNISLTENTRHTTTHSAADTAHTKITNRRDQTEKNRSIFRSFFVVIYAPSTPCSVFLVQFPRETQEGAKTEGKERGHARAVPGTGMNQYTQRVQDQLPTVSGHNPYIGAGAGRITRGLLPSMQRIRLFCNRRQRSPGTPATENRNTRGGGEEGGVEEDAPEEQAARDTWLPTYAWVSRSTVSYQRQICGTMVATSSARSLPSRTDSSCSLARVVRNEARRKTHHSFIGELGAVCANLRDITNVGVRTPGCIPVGRRSGALARSEGSLVLARCSTTNDSRRDGR